MDHEKQHKTTEHTSTSSSSVPETAPTAPLATQGDQQIEAPQTQQPIVQPTTVITISGPFINRLSKKIGRAHV